MAKRKTLDDLYYEAAMRAIEESKRKKSVAELRGEAAALAGIGISNVDEQRRALTEECGPFALSDRSDWLIGHSNAVYRMDEMATETTVSSLIRALGDVGFDVSVHGSQLHISGPGVALRVKIESTLEQPQVWDNPTSTDLRT